jgi:hypothetical protein
MPASNLSTLCVSMALSRFWSLHEAERDRLHGKLKPGVYNERKRAFLRDVAIVRKALSRP